MKIFLVLIVLFTIGIAYGFIDGANQGIPLTADTTPWVSIVIVFLLTIAWWLSRPKGDSDNGR